MSHAFNQFKLLNHHVQPEMDRLCPQERFCEDICMPNNHEAQFTCLCFRYDPPCPTYGYYDFVPKSSDSTVQSEQSSTIATLVMIETQTDNLLVEQATLIKSDFDIELLWSSEKRENSTEKFDTSLSTQKSTEIINSTKKLQNQSLTTGRLQSTNYNSWMIFLLLCNFCRNGFHYFDIKVCEYIESGGQ